MAIEFKPPLTTESIETQLCEISKKSLPKLTNDVLEKLWKIFESNYQEGSVPYALIFFTANMPPLKPDSTYEKMIGSTIKDKNAFDILYDEIDLNTIFKILSSDVNPEYKERCLSALFEKEDIATRIGSKDKASAIIRVWIKIRNGIGSGTSKIEFFHSCLLKTMKPMVKQGTMKMFKNTQEETLDNAMNDYITGLLSELPFNFTEQLNLLFHIKSFKTVTTLFNRLGTIINDENIPFNQRFDIFKSIYDVFTANYSPPLTETIRNLYSELFVFIQKNWSNDLLKNFLEQNKSDFSTFLSELDPNPIYNSLFTIINDPNYQKMLKNMSPKLSTMYEKMRIELDTLEFLQKLSNFHEENLIVFSKMIFPDKIENESAPSEKIKASDVIKEVIYNQTGYDDDNTLTENELCNKGNPLSLADNTPIGYNIYLPQGPPKGVFVRVYGGANRETKNSYLSRTLYLTMIDKALLKKGIVVISLNLADLIESSAEQLQLPKEIEDKIHTSIHQFYDTLKNHPDKLHANLQLPSNIPYSLFGTSFGGRTVIKHAENYPNTYDRIISYNGALSLEMLQKSDLPFGGRDYNVAQKSLDAILDIENINDDILLLHNMNDNNANLKVTLFWYEQAKKVGKQEKVRLYITDKGSPSPSVERALYTGHFPPIEKIPFNNMIDVIFNHIQFGSASMPELTDWRALRYDILANKNYKSASIEEKFISLAYRMCKQGIKNEDYKEKCANLYYLLDYLKRLPTDVQKRDIKALQDANLLTNEAITNALGSYLEQFLQFFKEAAAIQLPDKINVADFAKNQELHNQFRDVLNNPPDDEVLHFALFSLYQANPQLLEFYADKCKNDPIVQKNLENGLKKVEEKIAEEEKLISNVWLKTIQEVRKRIKLKRKEDFSEKSITPKAKKPYIPGPKRKKIKKK